MKRRKLTQGIGVVLVALNQWFFPEAPKPKKPVVYYEGGSLVARNVGIVGTFEMANYDRVEIIELPDGTPAMRNEPLPETEADPLACYYDFQVTDEVPEHAIHYDSKNGCDDYTVEYAPKDPRAAQGDLNHGEAMPKKRYRVIEAHYATRWDIFRWEIKNIWWRIVRWWEI